ncbi:MAG TPA: hypothetical protein VHR84_13030 [Terriglobales bacterium]|jgi:hypothetical protein|nr:hypothetical protein [Terriglobales bacterium]
MFTYLRNEIVVIAQYYFSLIAIAFAVGAFFFIKRFPHWMRILRASAWPTTSGQIEIADVSSFGGQAIAELGYSFAMEGTTYSGYYSHQFADEQEAWDYVTPLKGKHVVIRYKSTDPSTSTLLQQDQASDCQLAGNYLRSLWAFLKENWG